MSELNAQAEAASSAAAARILDQWPAVLASALDLFEMIVAAEAMVAEHNAALPPGKPRLAGPQEMAGNYRAKPVESWAEHCAPVDILSAVLPSLHGCAAWPVGAYGRMCSRDTIQLWLAHPRPITAADVDIARRLAEAPGGAPLPVWASAGEATRAVAERIRAEWPSIVAKALDLICAIKAADELVERAKTNRPAGAGEIVGAEQRAGGYGRHPTLPDAYIWPPLRIQEAILPGIGGFPVWPVANRHRGHWRVPSRLLLGHWLTSSWEIDDAGLALASWLSGTWPERAAEKENGPWRCIEPRPWAPKVPGIIYA